MSTWERVDVQLVVSAGMNIASGPVCTRPGGPVFLADGFARTEVSLNAFGRGRQSAPMPREGRRFDVSITRAAMWKPPQLRRPWMQRLKAERAQ